MNWTFGSFFRTLGRVFVYIFIGYILFNLINFNEIKLPKFADLIFMNVYANYEMGEVISNTTIEMNNYTLTPTNYSAYSPNSNINLHIESSNVWNPNNNDIDYQYGYISLCASNDFKPYNFTAGNFSKNARIFNSYQTCQVDGLNFDNSTIYYITWQINTNNACSTGATTTYCSLDNNYDFKNTNEVYFSLIDFGLSDTQIQVDTSSGQIIKNQNSNTINIINSQTNNTNSIINNQNQNKTDIINNQNANTDREIESQKVCTKEEITYTNFRQGAISYYNCVELGGQTRVFTTEYKLIKKGTYTITVDDLYFSPVTKLDNVCYDLTGVSGQWKPSGTQITFDNDYYVAFNVRYGDDSLIYPSSVNLIKVDGEEVCKNGNQAIGDSINDLNKSITDDTPPTNLDSLSNSAGWLPAGPVDSILNLPLSFLTNLNTNLSKSCQPVNLPLPFVNKNLPLPCVNTLYNEINGLPNWINIIGTIASAFILFGYFINLYKYIDDTLTFRENNYIDNWSGV